jgi:hypothetical protein
MKIKIINSYDDLDDIILSKYKIIFIKNKKIFLSSYVVLNQTIYVNRL